MEALVALAQQGTCCREVVGVVGATDEDLQVFGIGEGAAAFALQNSDAKFFQHFREGT